MGYEAGRKWDALRLDYMLQFMFQRGLHEYYYLYIYDTTVSLRVLPHQMIHSISGIDSKSIDPSLH